MPARSSSFLFSLRLGSRLVVGEGVLCGAVSSHARRWGALARPNGGLLLRVPLRGHPHLPISVASAWGVRTRSTGLIHCNRSHQQTRCLTESWRRSSAGGARSPTRRAGGGTPPP